MLIRLTALALLTVFSFLPFAMAKPDSVWMDSKNHSPKVKLNLPSFAPVVDTLAEAVVNISTEGKETSGFGFGGGNRRPFGREQFGGNPGSPFDFFFQVPPEGQKKRSFRTQSLGSGFVIHPSGYIVTNNHVVEKATKITIRFRDKKKKYTAKVIGSDPKTDLALLKVDADEPLSAVVFGDSDTLVPGDWVIAIGNPFRLGHTVTVGIVSAKSRKVPGGGPYDDFIQTDASINPGNSGGPLFNAAGEVVGINTAIFSPGSMGSSGFNIGIGFAIPINLAKNIITQLSGDGRVVRGWLGVLIQPVSEDVAEAMKLDAAAGALVADIVPDSPADKAGLQRGDVIVTYDGSLVQENDDLPLMVAQTQIGRVVNVEVVRKGKSKTLKVSIEELEETQSSSTGPKETESKLGLSVQDITPDLAKTLSLDSTSGVLVSNVVPDSAAQDAGLVRGDVVLEVSGVAVNSADQFQKATADLEKNTPLLILVQRGDNTVFLTLKLE